MSKWKVFLLTLSVCLFIGLLGLAVLYESTDYLYLASALPILIVLGLPDGEQHQYIRDTSAKRVRLTKQSEGEDARLTISFEPGFIRWKQARKLYLPLKSLRQAALADNPETAAPTSAQSDTTLAVLPFDLSSHPRKKGWIGIDLKQLAERTRSLAYTTAEVNKLSIRIADLEQNVLRSKDTTATYSGGSKQLQA